jgi:hypothetical protein
MRSPHTPSDMQDVTICDVQGAARAAIPFLWSDWQAQEGTRTQCTSRVWRGKCG